MKFQQNLNDLRNIKQQLRLLSEMFWLKTLHNSMAPRIPTHLKQDFSEFSQQKEYITEVVGKHLKG